MPPKDSRHEALRNFGGYSNRLRGSFPEVFKELLAVKGFSLQGNKLTGSLPEGLCWFTTVQARCKVSQNEFPFFLDTEEGGVRVRVKMEPHVLLALPLQC